MDGLFSGTREYVSRMFVTTDARQNAFIDLEQIPTSSNGLAGTVPAYGIAVAQPQTGFDWNIGNVGLGGTPSPIAYGVAAPLVANPDYATSFLGVQS